MRARYEGANELYEELLKRIPDFDRVIAEPAELERLSHDFYWFSPLLRPYLSARVAQAAVEPVSVEEIVAVLRLAYQRGTPVTMRGGGTSTSGQSVPLEGGILLDLKRMDAVEAITSDGVAICQAGARLAEVEQQARAHGWELRSYPTTLTRATVGGFLAAGSAGVGTVMHGAIRDADNVAAVEILTMEQEPHLARLEGFSAKQVLHAWGTNGIITRAWLRLSPAVEWAEVAAVFPTLDQAFHFARAVAEDSSWTKRLVSVFEPRMAEFLTPLKESLRPGHALVLLMTAAAEGTALARLVEQCGGRITLCRPFAGPLAKTRLSDYTWYHSTLWAMQQDAAWTNLQLGFEASSALEHCFELRQRYGDDILFHFEFMRNRDGAMMPAGLPIVRYQDDEQIQEMMDYCRSLGLQVANPHVFTLEDSGRMREDNLQMLGKMHYDHRGLLNPGKMRTFRPS